MSSNLHPSTSIGPRDNRAPTLVVASKPPGATSPGLIPCATAVAWAGLLVVGTAQLHLVRSAVVPRSAPVDPVVQAINVSLGDPGQPESPPTDQTPALPADLPPPPPQLQPIPDSPALTQIAPAPAMRPQSVARMASTNPGKSPAEHPPHPAGGATAGQPNYQPVGAGTLIGDMPDPQYPEEARDAGQQGTVVVWFTVDTNGGVTDVKVHTPCRWPILNAAAVEAIRDNWGPFQSGPKRYFEKSITYRQTGKR